MLGSSLGSPFSLSIAALARVSQPSNFSSSKIVRPQSMIQITQITVPSAICNIHECKIPISAWGHSTYDRARGPTHTCIHKIFYLYLYLYPNEAVLQRKLQGYIAQYNPLARAWAYIFPRCLIYRRVIEVYKVSFLRALCCQGSIKSSSWYKSIIPPLWGV